MMNIEFSEQNISLIIGGSIALVSSLVGAVVPHFLQSRTKKKNVLREKLESLYDWVVDWNNGCFTSLVLYFGLVIKDEISWDEYNDMIIEGDKKTEIKKADAVSAMYFPDIYLELEKSKMISQKLSRYINGPLKKAYLNGVDFHPYLQEYDGIVKSLNEQFTRIEDLMINKAKSLK